MSVACVLIEVDAEVLARGKLYPPFGEGAEPQLWSLQIGQNADRATNIAFQRADRLETFAVIVVRSVAEIKPKHIDTRLEQSTDNFRL